MKICVFCVSRGGFISSFVNVIIMFEGWVKFLVIFENEVIDIFNIEYFVILRFF